jgi:phosphatidylglycerol---prolipoprotein diacylglyceryl transferase
MHLISRGIVHHPFFFHVGNIAMSGYGIALVMAFLIAWVVIARENGRRGDDVAFAGEIILAASIGGLVGSKLFYAAFVGSGSILTRGGQSFWGGLIGGACAYSLWARLRHVSFFHYLDVIGMAIAAGYAVGRTGCWAIGDDYGRPWNSPFAVQFPEGAPPTTAANMQRIFGENPPLGSDATTIIAVHPTQLYETALGFVMFLVLWRLRDNRHAQGWLFGSYCVLAGVERFLIEFVRVEPDRLSIGLPIAQVVALAIILIGGLLMYARRGATKKTPTIGE